VTVSTVPTVIVYYVTSDFTKAMKAYSMFCFYIVSKLLTFEHIIGRIYLNKDKNILG